MKARREGFTLAELLVVAVMGTIILGAVYQTLVSQERSVRQSYAIVGTNQNLRTAMMVLTSDLREVSATDGDIVTADSVQIIYRAQRKAGVVCASDTTTGAWVDVVYFGDAFSASDSVLVYADGANAESANDDGWLSRVASSVGGTANCVGNPISATAIQRITFTAAATSTIRPGALIRSWVRVRYALQNSGTEGNLVRGEGADATPSGSSTPIVEDLGTISEQGLRFRYWDTTRTAITNLTTQAQRNTIGRIQIKLRGKAVGAGSGRTGTVREYSDSLVTNVYLRGNRKLQ